MEHLKDLIDQLNKSTNLDKEMIKKSIEIPPNPKLGDLAFPCFQLAKTFKKSPVMIAKELQSELIFDNSIIDSCTATGPYINFFYNYSKLTKLTFDKISAEKELYGYKPQNNKTVLVETPSPNTNKPLHLGHLRNMALGDSVARIINTQGFDVKKINLYNDRGVHICKSMLAYKLWGKNKEPDKKTDHFVGDYYILFQKKLSEDESLEEQAQEMLRKWEKGDPEVVAIWKKMNNWAFKGMEETFQKFGLQIDAEFYESNIYTKGKEIILKGLKNDIFYKDKSGAVAVDLGKNLGTKYLLRADGTAVYITQDIYLAKAKFDQFNYEKSIYVVASEQDYHFKVLFSILNKLGFSFADGCHHLSYGMVYLPEGKMKSREGKVVDADDLMDELSSMANKELQKRGTEDLEGTSSKIGISALKYYLLKIAPQKDITYNPAESISFEGDTGPYMQYSFVRAKRILEKLKLNFDELNINYDVIKEDSEKILVKQLFDFPIILEKSALDYSPSIITQYALGLAQNFNSFYEKCRVIGEPEDIQNIRAFIIYNFLFVLKSSLNLLGIETVNSM